LTHILFPLFNYSIHSTIFFITKFVVHCMMPSLNVSILALQWTFWYGTYISHTYVLHTLPHIGILHTPTHILHKYIQSRMYESNAYAFCAFIHIYKFLFNLYACFRCSFFVQVDG
jgi:hypothetical protein